MEYAPYSSGKCWCHGKCRLDQLSALRNAPTKQTQLDNSANAHTVIYPVTSSVTRSRCWKSPNRGVLAHFCCCLHRRRSLLKKWSRKHREGVSERIGEGEPGDLCLKRRRVRENEAQSESLRPFYQDNTSHFNPLLSNISQVNKVRQGIPAERTTDNVSALSERLRGDTCLCGGMSSEFSGAKRSANETDVDCVGASSTTPRTKRGMEVPCDEGDDDVRIQSRIRSPLHSCPDITLGRLISDLAGYVSCAVPTTVQTMKRLCGGCRKRLGERHESRTLNPTTQLTFHRWVYLILICIMVLPIESSSASGLPYQGSVEEEPGHEPGYKQSYYQNLPPKAVYESVIICLLAVSAFIGLIVWVLKSNFEERQQKRMRREASLRERTSSVAFLKT